MIGHVSRRELLREFIVRAELGLLDDGHCPACCGVAALVGALVDYANEDFMDTYVCGSCGDGWTQGISPRRTDLLLAGADDAGDIAVWWSA